MGILICLAAQEEGAQHDSEQQVARQRIAVASDDGPPGKVHWETTAQQHHCIDCGLNDLSRADVVRPVTAIAHTQIQVGCDQVGEKDGLRRQEEDHAIPTKSASFWLGVFLPDLSFFYHCAHECILLVSM